MLFIGRISTMKLPLFSLSFILFYNRAQLPEHMFEHEAKRVQFCASLDRPKEEGLKCDHDQDHQQPGEAEEREKRENTDTTLHRHLQGTEDTDPDLQWREEIFHPPENHGNLPPLAEKRHGRKGGLRSLATDPDLQWREEVFHPHTHPPENHGNLLPLTEEKHGRKGGLQSLSKFRDCICKCMED